MIDEETYRREVCRILFISSEANDDAYSVAVNKELDTTEDYRTYYCGGHDDWKGKMHERLSECIRY